MATDEPPYLTIGTDVSAKYKGAFCEAKIKKANRVVKCKVNFKNNLGTFMVTDDQIKGPLRVGAEVEAKHPEKGQFLEAVINKLQDYSQYTVVFDDGDETTLRRTSLCLKSGRHFAESPTLDQFPLTNPEHFSSPVIGTSKFKRKRRSTMNSSLDLESSDDESVPRKVKAIRDKEHNPDLGRVVCVDFGDRRKKENWYPGLIMPLPQQSNIKMLKEEHLVRSFKDGKYYQVPKRDTREFNRESIQKVDNNALRSAVEKAVNYLEKDELPPHWEKALFAGLDVHSADEDSRDSDSDTSDDEPSEEKDRFVAQLYKFMDERGTPINKAPTVSNRDLNLYKLFKIMHKLGGYNKVTNKNKWKAVYLKMGLPASNPNGPNQIKFAYKRFLQSFEDFYRKLGCTMVSNSRSTRGRHRSDRNFIVTRTRDRESPKGRKNSKEPKEKAPAEKKGDEKPKASVPEKKEAKPEEAEEKPPKTPEKKRAEKPRPPEEDKKSKKEEKPRLVRSQSLTKDKKDSPKGKDKEVVEKARTREDARKEKNESPEKKGTRSTSKVEPQRKEEHLKKEAKPSPKEKETRKEEKQQPEERDPRPKGPKKEPPPRKPAKEKKPEEKPTKEKREVPPRDKKEDKLTVATREKAESPRDPPPKDEKPKLKKEEPRRTEERSPKRKLERLTKEKKEVRSRSEEKPSPGLPETPKRHPPEETKEERPPKVEVEIKKEEKPRLKLRERKEDAPPSEEEGGPESGEEADEGKDVSSQDESEKKTPPGRHRGDDGEEPPNKGKRRALKLDDKDEKESLCGMSDSDDGSFTTDCSEKLDAGREVEIGDRVKVKYGRGRLQKVYEAKVLKVEPDGAEKRYYVHYAGWNTRYDEWVRKNYIVANVSGKQKDNAKSSSPTSLKKVDRGRPPGVLANTRPDRKNSTGSLRATRSEKKGSQAATPPPCRGPEQPKRRPRKKSVTATDVSQEEEEESETEGMSEDEAPPFKEELFSDDEEKEKLEEVKRGDITELEKAICVEESEDGIKAVVDLPPVAKQPELDLVPIKMEALAPPEEEEQMDVKPVPVETEVPPLPIAPKPSNEVKEAVPDLSMMSSTSPSVSACSVNLGRFVPPQEEMENKSALSFAGLIKKSPFEKPDASPKLDSPFLSLMESDPQVGDFECSKSGPATVSPFKSSPVFDEDLNSAQNSASSKEKFDSKSISTLFDSILKQPEQQDSCDVSKSSQPDKDSEKGETPSSENSKTPDLPRSSESPPPKLEDDSGDFSKPKDHFNILHGGATSFCPADSPKRSDSKDDIFSFTFSPHNASKDTLASDQPYGNTPSEDSSLYRKPSETVDVSKMIPGILERLKKDVVADVSDSPPPPKEELNFDFLRGSSQGVSKSLSRSDSSNSLRICESDTNDSNLESKDSPADVSLDAVALQEKPKLFAVVPDHRPEVRTPTVDPPASSPQKEESPGCDLQVVIDPAPDLDSLPPAAVDQPEEEVPDDKKNSPPIEECPAPEEEEVRPELCPVVESASPSLDDLSAAAALSSELPPVDPVASNPEDQRIVGDVKVELVAEEDVKEKLSPCPAVGQSSVIKFTSDAVKEEEEQPDEERAVKEEGFQEGGDQDTTLTAEEDEKPSNPVPADDQTRPAVESVASVIPEEDSSNLLSNKKDPKKKKLGKKVGKSNPEKEPKLKAKKRLKQLEAGGNEWDKAKADLKTKSKKLKKSKNKKRFLRHEEAGGERKMEFRDDDPEKLKRREKKRSEKKFLKSSPKGDEELTKKKKSKKNREKFIDKKEFLESSSSTKKTKKKRKSHLEENQDTDSDRESVCKAADGKKRKRKKFKVKECSSSDEGEKPLFKEKVGKEQGLLLRQDSKSDDPDMSFLLCEEKVPASPAGGDLADDTSGSSSGDENRTHRMDLLPGVYPGCSGGKHGIDTVLDNTPPTTPSSTESLLSSSPSHGGDRDPFPPAGYPESTQSGGSERLFQCGGGRVMPARGSEEYRAATTLAFAVCKSAVSDPSRSREGGAASFGKRSKGADSAPNKRKKKRVQRYPETTKSPKHKSTYPRVAKVENYCEDSSGTSPATSSSPPYGSLSSPCFSRSLPNRLTEGTASRYSYVPLHEKDPEKRISVLQDKMAALRKRYMALRAEVIAIDHKRRKARKKVREAAGMCGNPSVQSEDGPSCS